LSAAREKQEKASEDGEAGGKNESVPERKKPKKTTDKKEALINDNNPGQQVADSWPERRTRSGRGGHGVSEGSNNVSVRRRSELSLVGSYLRV
jgi:hypothetical protein